MFCTALDASKCDAFVLIFFVLISAHRSSHLLFVIYSTAGLVLSDFNNSSCVIEASVKHIPLSAGHCNTELVGRLMMVRELEDVDAGSSSVVGGA